MLSKKIEEFRECKIYKFMDSHIKTFFTILMLIYLLPLFLLCSQPLGIQAEHVDFISYCFIKIISIFLIIAMFVVIFVIIYIFEHNELFSYYGNINKIFILLSSIILLIITFSVLYALIMFFDDTAFNISFKSYNNIFDKMINMLYFSTMTLTTVGYGDIAPVSSKAKFFVSIEAMIFTVVISFIIMNFTKSNENKKNLKNKEDIHIDSKNTQDRNNITINIESNNSTITTTINITDLLKPELKGNKEKDTEQNEENNNE